MCRKINAGVYALPVRLTWGSVGAWEATTRLLHCYTSRAIRALSVLHYCSSLLLSRCSVSAGGHCRSQAQDALDHLCMLAGPRAARQVENISLGEWCLELSVVSIVPFSASLSVSSLESAISFCFPCGLIPHPALKNISRAIHFFLFTLLKPIRSRD